MNNNGIIFLILFDDIFRISENTIELFVSWFNTILHYWWQVLTVRFFNSDFSYLYSPLTRRRTFRILNRTLVTAKIRRIIPCNRRKYWRATLHHSRLLIHLGILLWHKSLGQFWRTLRPIGILLLKVDVLIF